MAYIGGYLVTAMSLIQCRVAVALHLRAALK
jgi:hypothetical protein